MTFFSQVQDGSLCQRLSKMKVAELSSWQRLAWSSIWTICKRSVGNQFCLCCGPLWTTSFRRALGALFTVCLGAFYKAPRESWSRAPGFLKGIGCFQIAPGSFQEILGGLFKVRGRPGEGLESLGTLQGLGGTPPIYSRVPKPSSPFPWPSPGPVG